MNHIVTSKPQLLEAAKKIASEGGISQINMRRLAAECGISVGSIYNYFPTKTDLLIAVIEDFWKSVFHNGICMPVNQQNFVDFVGMLYGNLHEYLKTFQTDFLQQLSALSPADRQKGKAIEATYMEHIKQGLLMVLEQDTSISPAIWSQGFAKADLVSFTFFNMMTLLRSNQADCLFFQQVLTRLLHPASGELPQ